MIEVKGTAAEIEALLKDIAPTYPYELIEHLGVGTWVFSRNECMIMLNIVEAKNEKADG